uniref:Uncharacterized protein n=1 Tax=Anguilla anguilla TaxID=7936 RepID=A0A0E9XDM4_ANGAN
MWNSLLKAAVSCLQKWSLVQFEQLVCDPPMGCLLLLGVAMEQVGLSVLRWC